MTVFQPPKGVVEGVVLKRLPLISEKSDEHSSDRPCPAFLRPPTIPLFRVSQEEALRPRLEASGYGQTRLQLLHHLPRSLGLPPRASMRLSFGSPLSLCPIIPCETYRRAGGLFLPFKGERIASENRPVLDMIG
jgi:hypothetical protein